MNNNFRKLKYLGLLFLVTLGISACTIQFTTIVQPDGSGELRVEFGLRPDEQAELESIATSLDSLCTAPQDWVRVPSGSKTYVAQRGEEQWCGTSLPFANLNDLQALLVDQPGVLVNQIVFLEDRFIFDVTINVSRKLEIQGQKYVAPDVVWQLTVPGTLVGHNADTFEDNTLTWIVRRGELRTLRAESVLSIPSSLFGTGLPTSFITLIGLPCLCLLGLAGAGFAWWRLRKRKAA